MKSSHRLSLVIGFGVFVLFSILALFRPGYSVSTYHLSHDTNLTAVDELHAQQAEQYEKDESALEQHQLNTLGYLIKKGDVKFVFTDPQSRAGPVDHIVDLNRRRYLDVVRDQKVGEPKDFDLETIRPPKRVLGYDHAKATIYSFVRNDQKDAMAESVKSFERSFNSKFQYPYTFFNDEPFTQEFKEKLLSLTKAPMYFYQVDPQFWDPPKTVNVDKMLMEMDTLEELGVANAKLDLFRRRSRLNLLMLPKLPQLDRYKWYWRLEPDSRYFTDVNYDVFKYLDSTGKVFGFTVNTYEDENAIGTLWKDTIKWLNQGDNYKYVNENGAFQWLTENLQLPLKTEQTGGYSGCQFWSSFEIGNLDFFRGEAYALWTSMLDASNNFFYQCWGDSPVHSIGLGLFADKNNVHWFRDLAFHHAPFFNCPLSDSTTGCDIAKFADNPALTDKNCLINWLDYSMTSPLQSY